MEIMAMGFLMGVVFSIIIAGMGAIYAGTDKGQFNDDSDMRVYVPSRNRDRRGNNGDHKPLDKIDDESLSAILRAIATIEVSDDAKGYLNEAADRLEVRDDKNNVYACKVR